VKQFPKIPVRLKDAWPSAALDPLFRLQDEALKKRRKQQNSENLKNLENNVVQHGGSLPSRR
jgi:hypothetical protein